MFGLLAGGALFGFVGVLLAVPVTAVIGVLIRFGLGEYLRSAIYLDSQGAAAAEPDQPIVPARERDGQSEADADAPPAP